MHTVGSIVGLETSPLARQVFLTVNEWLGGATPAATLVRYRDLASWYDPDETIVRDRRHAPLLARLVDWLRAHDVRVIVVAPDATHVGLLGRLCRRLRRALPTLVTVVVGPAAIAQPVRVARAFGGRARIAPDVAALAAALGVAPRGALDEPAALPPPDVDEPLPVLYTETRRETPVDPGALARWLTARRTVLLARRSADADPDPTLDPRGALVVRLVGRQLVEDPERRARLVAAFATGPDGLPDVEVACVADWTRAAPRRPAFLPFDRSTGAATRAAVRAAAAEGAAVAAALAGPLLPAGGREAAEGLLREALGDVAGAHTAMARACATRATPGRPLFELARLTLAAAAPDRLARLGDAGRFAIDPLWAATQVALAEIARRRPAAGVAVARAARALVLGDRPDGGLPVRATLDLLRAEVWGCAQAGDTAGAREASAHLRAHPAGRTPADLANAAVLAGTAPSSAAAPRPPKKRPAPPRRDVPDVTLVALLRDEETGARVAPAGVLHLAAALRAAGRTAVVVDRQLAPRERFDDVDDLVASLGEPGRVIGLSAMADRLPLVVRAARALRRAFPDRVLVAGGPGPSGVATALLRLVPELDAVVRGEGEDTLVELVARVHTGGVRALPGLPGATVRRRRDAAVLEGPPRPRRTDLDTLPPPAYDAVDLAAYDDVTIVTSRGCPHACAFCDATGLWGHHRVTRRVEAVVDELTLLRERYGRRHVHVEDDTFLLPRERTRAFCQAIHTRLPDLTWGCLVRADTLDERAVDMLLEGGCRSLFVGLESGSNAVLRHVAKGVDAATATQAALLAVRRIALRAYYVWGFPHESYDDFLRTFAAAALLRAEGADVGYALVAPLPTTPLYLANRGRLRYFAELRVPRLFHPPQAGSEDARLVEGHPDVFPAFRVLYSPEFERKREFVERYAASDVPIVTPAQ